MYSHKKLCAKHHPLMCYSRTHMPTFYIKLKPNYSLVEIKKFRITTNPNSKPMAKMREYKLGIKYAAEYLARPLPSGGLDLMHNPKKGAEASDQADFYFQLNKFEITDMTCFEHMGPVQRRACSLEHNTKAFIGDVKLLTEGSGNHTYHTVAGDGFFREVYMDDQLIGYAVLDRLSGYDTISGDVICNEGIFAEMVLKYTDKASNTVDGIILAEIQNENWYNFEDTPSIDIELCPDCRSGNSKF